MTGNTERAVTPADLAALALGDTIHVFTEDRDVTGEVSGVEGHRYSEGDEWRVTVSTEDVPDNYSAAEIRLNDAANFPEGTVLTAIGFTDSANKYRNRLGQVLELEKVRGGSDG